MNLPKSKIPYLTHRCDCVRGCTLFPVVCDNCWAARDAWRMAHNPNPTIKATAVTLASVWRYGDKAVLQGAILGLVRSVLGLGCVEWRPKQTRPAALAKGRPPAIPAEIFDLV